MTTAGDALLIARRDGLDPFDAVFDAVGGESHLEAAVESSKNLISPLDLDSRDLIQTQYAFVRGALLALYEAIEVRAVRGSDPAIEALDYIQQLNERGQRGMGIADAFVSAELLLDAVHVPLAGGYTCHAALADYSPRGDAITANGFALTLRTAALEAVSDHMLRSYACAADDPNRTSRVLGAMGGAIALDEVYSRDRIAAKHGGVLR
jgi:hypothetical protein